MFYRRVSHSDNHEWDMKHPQRSECKERRHSSSSNSSQPRGTSRCTKETKNQSTEPDITAQQMHDKVVFDGISYSTKKLEIRNICIMKHNSF